MANLFRLQHKTCAIKKSYERWELQIFQAIMSDKNYVTDCCMERRFVPLHAAVNFGIRGCCNQDNLDSICDSLGLAFEINIRNYLGK